MAEGLRERLLVTYADMGEAMVAQNVLEAGGVPCRIADLAHIPSHVLGIAGGWGRSVGVWVLEMDVERANSLLAMGISENDVDEEALAAEAMAAAVTAGEEREAKQAVAPVSSDPAPIEPTHSPWFVRAMFSLLVAMVALFVARGCH